MEERTNVEKVEVERTEIDRTEVNKIDIPQSEAEKPNLLKRGGAWLKRNGPTILKGAGLVLAGIAVGAFVGLCACKRNEEVYEPAEDDGDDYDYDNDDEIETETEDSSDFDYESTEEES